MHSPGVHLGDFGSVRKGDLSASQLEAATLHLLLLDNRLILRRLLPLLWLVWCPRRGGVGLSVNTLFVAAWCLPSWLRGLSVCAIHIRFIVVVVEAGQITRQILGRMYFLIWDLWFLVVEYFWSVHIRLLSRKIKLGRIMIFLITWNISIVFGDR